MAAFGEAHQPTWVSSKELSLAQMNPKNAVRNGDHHMREFHRILPISFKAKRGDESQPTTKIQ